MPEVELSQALLRVYHQEFTAFVYERPRPHVHIRQCHPVSYRLWYFPEDALARLKDVLHSALCGF